MSVQIVELDSHSNRTQYTFQGDPRGSWADNAFATLVLRFMHLKGRCPVTEALEVFKPHFPAEIKRVKQKVLERETKMWITEGTTVFHSLIIDHGEVSLTDSR